MTRGVPAAPAQPPSLRLSPGRWWMTTPPGVARSSEVAGMTLAELGGARRCKRRRSSATDDGYRGASVWQCSCDRVRVASVDRGAGPGLCAGPSAAGGQVEGPDRGGPVEGLRRRPRALHPARARVKPRSEGCCALHVPVLQPSVLPKLAPRETTADQDQQHRQSVASRAQRSHDANRRGSHLGRDRTCSCHTNGSGSRLIRRSLPGYRAHSLPLRRRATPACTPHRPAPTLLSHPAPAPPTHTPTRHPSPTDQRPHPIKCSTRMHGDRQARWSRIDLRAGWVDLPGC